MKENGTDAKDKIIIAAIEILNEINDTDKITIRQIAERANVGVGLINYHFQTKENLLHKAVVVTMAGTVSKYQKITRNTVDDPVQRLKVMLIELSDIAMRHEKFHRITVSYEISQGNIETPLHYISLLREIFGNQKDEIELRIISLQLLSTMQLVLLRTSAFQLYSGIDVHDKTQRDKFICTLVDNLIKK